MGFKGGNCILMSKDKKRKSKSWTKKGKRKSVVGDWTRKSHRWMLIQQFLKDAFKRDVVEEDWTSADK